MSGPGRFVAAGTHGEADGAEGPPGDLRGGFPAEHAFRGGEERPNSRPGCTVHKVRGRALFRSTSPPPPPPLFFFFFFFFFAGTIAWCGQPALWCAICSSMCGCCKGASESSRADRGGSRPRGSGGHSARSSASGVGPISSLGDRRHGRGRAGEFKNGRQSPPGSGLVPQTTLPREARSRLGPSPEVAIATCAHCWCWAPTFGSAAGTRANTIRSRAGPHASRERQRLSPRLCSGGRQECTCGVGITGRARTTACLSLLMSQPGCPLFLLQEGSSCISCAWEIYRQQTGQTGARRT